MTAEIKVKTQVYSGLFMVTLATLMYEILLTRIFSVTMWYHFAFMAISIAMFGMTVGAILVYLFPDFFTRQRAIYHMSLSSFLFSITIVLSFMTHLSVPFLKHVSLVTVFSLALTYFVISLPFVFSGICVCLALTKFPAKISKLYAADLAGAGIGCILLIYVLEITDGPTAVFVTALLAGAGAILFGIGEGNKRLLQAFVVSTVILLCFAVFNTVLANKQRSLIRPIFMKGYMHESRPLYEKWNSFSYITVQGDIEQKVPPYSVGLSYACPIDSEMRHLSIAIDVAAVTQLTGFDGDYQSVQHLKYDLTNLVHNIRQDSKVLVVGAGGGRDVLSALVFGQKAVKAVEINANINKATNEVFGDFTGHLDQKPGVSFVVDEARSYVARQKENYDIIVVSLIDTWAATAAGAFILSEHSLYTVEAWEDFLNHLTPRGVLSFSYWYSPEEKPGLMYRLTSLARETLTRQGVSNPRDHIVIVRLMYKDALPGEALGLATILVGKEKFSEKDIATIEDVARRMDFDMVLSPGFSIDSTFADIADGKDLDTSHGRFPINIKAPTDNNPFFFYLLRLRDTFRPGVWKMIIEMAGGGPLIAVFILGALVIIACGLTFIFIIVPLMLTSDKEHLKGSLPFFLFFLSIGFGFMMVEISQMQRLIMFLGHPTYGLSVVLFSLLLSSGLGSLLTEKVTDSGLKNSGTARLALLLLVLLIFGIITPYITETFRASVTPVRILMAVVILFPLGIFMGMAFPLGMKAASRHSTLLTPWLWGVNGATSVCASVFAIALALNTSISTAFWVGFAFYTLALLAFVRQSRKQ